MKTLPSLALPTLVAGALVLAGCAAPSPAPEAGEEPATASEPAAQRPEVRYYMIADT